MKAFAIALLASIALPVVAHAGEQNLEFKFVVKPIVMKAIQAPNIEGRQLAVGSWFGVAFFKDGRVAVKDFVDSSDPC